MAQPLDFTGAALFFYDHGCCMESRSPRYQVQTAEVSREVTAQEMEQVIGGAKTNVNNVYIGNLGTKKTQIYMGR